MKALIKYIKKLFVSAPRAVTDEHCFYCHGLGYDSSGFNCICLKKNT